MPTTYKIREGFTFVESIGKVKRGGEEISIEDDVYRMHAHKLERVDTDEAPAVQTSAKPKAPPAPRAAPAPDTPEPDAAE